jgi:hypothetical protein
MHKRADSGTSVQSFLTSAQGKNIIIGSPGVSIYKGKSDRPLGWKARRPVRTPLGQAIRDANITKFDGAARTPIEWDGLRRVRTPAVRVT